MLQGLSYHELGTIQKCKLLKEKHTTIKHKRDSDRACSAKNVQKI